MFPSLNGSLSQRQAQKVARDAFTGVRVDTPVNVPEFGGRVRDGIGGQAGVSRKIRRNSVTNALQRSLYTVKRYVQILPLEPNFKRLTTKPPTSSFSGFADGRSIFPAWDWNLQTTAPLPPDREQVLEIHFSLRPRACALQKEHSAP